MPELQYLYEEQDLARDLEFGWDGTTCGPGHCVNTQQFGRTRDGADYDFLAINADWDYQTGLEWPLRDEP